MKKSIILVCLILAISITGLLAQTQKEMEK
jgi:hypothetical protein